MRWTCQNGTPFVEHPGLTILPQALLTLPRALPTSPRLYPPQTGPLPLALLTLPRPYPPTPPLDLTYPSPGLTHSPKDFTHPLRVIPNLPQPYPLSPKPTNPPTCLTHLPLVLHPPKTIPTLPNLTRPLPGLIHGGEGGGRRLEGGVRESRPCVVTLKVH